VTSRAKSAPKETTLRTGERVLLRAIGPADKQALVHGLHRMSPKSRYRRFFSPVEELGASQLRYLTEVNHHTHEALIAINPNTGDPVGVARFIRSGDDSEVAEVAIAVVDDWQGRGVGTELLLALCDRASEEGVRRFSASVLESNKPMLGLLRDLGDVEVLGREQEVVELLMDLPAHGGGDALRQTVRGAATGRLTVEAEHPTSHRGAAK
jgi:RimJ/RimL family protein N-acetyltransferase